MFGDKFEICDGMLKVSGFQPDFIAFDERGESLVVMQGHDLMGEFMGSEVFVSSGDEGLQSSFDYKNGKVGD